MTDPNTTPGTMPPDMVNAIVRDMDDPRYPSQITVFCDHCGIEDTGEYMVSEAMTPTERLAVAQQHLVEHKGWEHDADTGDDYCPEHAAPKPSAPDCPYTDNDLRAEAARQHATLTEDPDYMGVGEGMDGRYVRYEVVDPDHGGQMPAPGSPRWDDLDEDQYDEAQRKIHDLINGAAYVSDWAVGLGADGLEPEDHQFTLNADDRPIIRAHFAFAPELSDDARTAFVEGLGAAAAREMQIALEETAEVTIPAEIAAHVLWQERLGGWPPSTSAAKLLDAWTSADTPNAERLAVAFPEYAAAIALMRSGGPGVEQLRAIADASVTF